MSCYLMANQNTTSCFAAPQEGTASEVQVDRRAIAEAFKAFSSHYEDHVEAMKALDDDEVATARAFEAFTSHA